MADIQMTLLYYTAPLVIFLVGPVLFWIGSLIYHRANLPWDRHRGLLTQENLIILFVLVSMLFLLNLLRL